MQSKVFAGVVSYNPEIDKIKANLEAVCPQADTVVVADNGSENIPEVEALCASFSNVVLIRIGENLGIAAAFNRIFRYADANGAQWVITLDQDSCLHSDYLEQCRKYMRSKKVVSLTTLRYDRNTGIDGEPHHDERPIEKVKTCISSGNIIRTRVWKEIGGFNEPLFIDDVDHEFCYRLRAAGYSIYQINQCLITHELGNSRLVHILGKDRLVMNHGAWRKYYYFRNTVYMIRYIPLAAERNWRWELTYMFLKTLLLEDQKWEKTKASLRGIRDGRRMPETDFAEQMKKYDETVI